ncbi:hypothetical protein PP479_02090 [Pseudomonas aeruginosa]|uniref:hypothetical protein n=1 Tax=Pseudomonas aeruginosa TaxID=287 RepID=UPI002B2575BF|nr:hypothetical protein [Pseudomonas aeruginosa]WOX95352.1 hypothetical protein PP479_02090 [Pseudomonas aeruginosa]HCE0322392.1 hypothetical protein [Pseudomonas aeruginosa]HCE3951676.1 hypothetical protein [Pseudomonas aeruginosa]
MSALVPAPPRKASQLAILAQLGEAIVINRATGTSASRTRLIVLLDLAEAVSAISAGERQAVIGGAK